MTAVQQQVSKTAPGLPAPTVARALWAGRRVTSRRPVLLISAVESAQSAKPARSAGNRRHRPFSGSSLSLPAKLGADGGRVKHAQGEGG